MSCSNLRFLVVEDHEFQPMQMVKHLSLACHIPKINRLIRLRLTF